MSNLKRHVKRDKIKWAIVGVALLFLSLTVVGVCLQLFGNGKIKPSEWFKKDETEQVSPEEEKAIDQVVRLNELETNKWETDYDGDLSVFKTFSISFCASGYSTGTGFVSFPNVIGTDDVYTSDFFISGHMSGPSTTDSYEYTLTVMENSSNNIEISVSRKSEKGYTPRINWSHCDLPDYDNSSSVKFMFGSFSDDFIDPTKFLCLLSSSNNRPIYSDNGYHITFAYNDNFESLSGFYFRYNDEFYYMENPLKHNRLSTELSCPDIENAQFVLTISKNTCDFFFPTVISVLDMSHFSATWSYYSGVYQYGYLLGVYNA